MNFPPSKEQKHIFDVIDNDDKNVLISAVAGSGKCLGKNTPILMYDGSIKRVQDVIVGDQIMGDDSLPRNVLSTVSNIGPLRRIIPKKGDEWVCNDVHILTLNNYKRKWIKRKQVFTNEIIDIPVNELENLSKNKKSLIHKDGTFRYHKQIRTGVEFDKKEVPFSPWLYGLWLGDGTKGQSSFTNNNVEIFDYLKKIELPKGTHVSIKKYGEKCETIKILKNEGEKQNIFRRFVRQMSTKNGDKYINDIFKINDRKVRLELLAGLIDSDGYVNNGVFITTKYKTLCDDILYLCRSLGFAAYSSYNKKKCHNNGKIGWYYNISISGDISEIPTVISYKKSPIRRQIKNVNHVGFKIIDEGVGDYYGFEIDGNKRFLLGDFTVTHNTTTLLMLLERIPRDKTILFMAYNKSIADELKSRIPPSCRNVDVTTVHGYGKRILETSKQIEIRKYKYGQILNTIFNSVAPKNDLESLKNLKFNKEQKSYTNKILTLLKKSQEIESEFNLGQFGKIIINLCMNGRLGLVDILNKVNGVSELREISKHHGYETFFGDAECAWYLMKIGLEMPNVIDFTDMITFPIRFGLKQPKYDFVFVDECQDINVCQRLLMLGAVKEDGGRFIAVGDEKQCQPKGTKILMSDLTEKNIEDLKVGDHVVSYDVRKTHFTGFGSTKNSGRIKVNQTHISTRLETIFKIKLKNGFTSEYSSNHKCYVKLDVDKMSGKYVVYLMRKNNSFRVGLSPCNTTIKGFTFGPTVRSRSETADSLWILGVFNNRNDAFINEQIISNKFGIPQMRFKDTTLGKYNGLNQNNIDEFWDSMGDLTEKAKILLKSYNLFIDFPLWKKTNNHGGIGNCWKLSSHGMFKTQSCNIIPEIMVMCFFDKNNVDDHFRVKRKFSDIEKIEIREEFIELYSLDVEKNHNYVADGILTSNSIYGFAGADSQSFNKIRNEPNTIELPLSVTYRCPKQIVETISHINPLIKHNEGNDQGILVDDFKVDHLTTGDMVLCRYTKPLVGLCIGLIKSGRKAYLMGTDIGTSMVNLIKDKKRTKEEYTMTNVFGRLYKDLEKILENLKIKHNLSNDEALKDDSYVSLKEKVEMIEIIGEEDENPEEVIKKIIDLFTDDKGPGICLSTVHKSKGLESERVIILNPNLMPSNRARLPWQVEQEDNLIYVAHTRTKKLLGFIRNFEKEHISRKDTIKLIKESEHVGMVGHRMKLDLKITDIRPFNSKWGPTVVNDMVDKDGNLFSLFGQIKSEFLVDDEKFRTEVGDEISCYGIISEHTVFNKTKINRLNRLSKF